MSRRLAIAAVLVALLCGSGVAAWAAEPILVERVVAVVEGEVITLSRVDLEARVVVVKRLDEKGSLRIRVEPGPGGAMLQVVDREGRARPVRITEELLGDVLDLMINWRIIHAEAARLRIKEIRAEEGKTLRQSFAARFVSADDYRAFLSVNEISEPELTEILARARRVELYAEERIDIAARPSEEEIRRTYDEVMLWTEQPFWIARNDIALLVVSVSSEDDARRVYDEIRTWKGRPFNEVQGTIARWLYLKRFRGALKDWIRALREKRQVRLVGEPLPRTQREQSVMTPPPAAGSAGLE